jgi:hypothetical protein
MATKKPTTTKARVLVAGHYGQPDDVVELSAEQVAEAVKSGQVDADPAAVAYAESK